MPRFHNIKSKEDFPREDNRSDAELRTVVLTEANALKEVDRFVQFLRSLSDKPVHPSNRRGIVICGGGEYFPSAWVCINMLRHLGCVLPVELWHLGPQELGSIGVQLLKSLSVTCVDGLEMRKRLHVREIGGWELKCFALVHTEFREVLLLDADNVPLVDPTYLFDTPQFGEAGSVFWRDLSRLSSTAKIWNLTGVPFQLEPEFESGQILIDKSKCYQPLRLAMWFNDHSSFWYQYLYGDKDTFHIAWRKLNHLFAMPPYDPIALPATMCQHDFGGRRIFQHRNKAKWKIRGNRRIRGFQFEEECLGFIERLVPYWKDIAGVSLYCPDLKGPHERQAAHRLVSERWIYNRVGHEQRAMTFSEDGTVRDGKAGLELYWDIVEESGAIFLDIQSEFSRTCRLQLEAGIRWCGRWDCHERMPIELLPAPSLISISQETQAQEEEKLIREFFEDTSTGLFLRIAQDHSRPDATIAMLLERGWSGLFVQPNSETPMRYWRASNVFTPQTGTQDARHLDTKMDESRLSESTVASNDCTNTITNVTHLIAATEAREILFLCGDHVAVREKLILSLLQQSICPRLILWSSDRYPEIVRQHEDALTARGYVQIFQNSRSRGWAFLGKPSDFDEFDPQSSVDIKQRQFSNSQ